MPIKCLIILAISCYFPYTIAAQIDLSLNTIVSYDSSKSKPIKSLMGLKIKANFNEQPKLRSELEFNNDSTIFVKQFDFRFRNKIETIGSYSVRNGKLVRQGRFVSVNYPSRDTLSISFYDNGMLNGRHTDFYVNNLIKRKMNYENNIVNGEYIVFGLNGKKLVEGNYRNGRPFNFWKYYWDNGNKRGEGKYLDTFYIDSFKSQQNKEDNAVRLLYNSVILPVKIKEWKYYDKNGKLSWTETYSKNGYLLNINIYGRLRKLPPQELFEDMQ